MRTSDTTPIRDPRNAVGLLTDVFALAVAGPAWAKYAPDAGVDACVQLGREVSKMPRSYTNGYKRRGGSSALYQRIKVAHEQLPADPDWRLRDNARREVITTMNSLGMFILRVATDVLEDEKRWEKFISETHEPANAFMGYPAKTNPPEWRKAWLDHVSGAARLGADLSAIATFECEWRFRDLTDRSHRGRNVRAAWEAAWLSGNYKFATELIESIL